MTTPVDPNEMHLIDASAAELNALLEIVTRAPKTRGETLFIEALFMRWHENVALGVSNENTPAPPAPPG